MAYIISVNAIIISDTGGPCKCNPPSNTTNPLCIGDPEYEDCKTAIKRDLITATAAITCLATAVMGIFANLPLGVAPGMGVNAYFAYTVVGYNGSGKVPYKDALGAVFLEGIIFFVLSLFGIRQWFAKLIPNTIKLATSVGIGLFLAFIGLQKAAGIALVTNDDTVLVALGGCPDYALDSSNTCTGHQMEGPKTWLGIFGLVLMTLLMIYKVKGALLIGIGIVSILSWIRPTPFTNFPYTPSGNESFDFFSTVAGFYPIQKTLNVANYNFSDPEIWIALVTLLYVDIMDTTGTLYSMAKFGNFLDKNGNFEGESFAFLCDSSCITIGSLFGCAPVTAFIESGAGITEGGKTGITALMVSLLFFVSLFLAPIFSSIPPWATGPAIILVGTMMIRSSADIRWGYLGDALPAFVSIILMPLTYSIANGLIGGIGTYLVINGIIWGIRKITCGKVVPDWSEKEVYHCIKTGRYCEGILPFWMIWVYFRIKGKDYTEMENNVELDTTVKVEI